MAYLPRNQLIWDGAIFHVTWQCHNHSWLMEKEWAKQFYYDLLLKYKDRYRVVFYSYHFMDNHIHLSGKIEGTREAFSGLFRIVNALFAREVNKRFKRRGQVVMDRFKSPVIQTDEGLLSVMHYHDLNSYRVGKVGHPLEYKWSSYRYYAEGREDPLITPAPSYLGLGRSDRERRERYRSRVERILSEEGCRKRLYSRTQYIGDPEWVAKRYAEIREQRRLKRLAYLKRQQKLYRQVRSP
ncbi:MAG: transposase [Deltaproteobacteria bacterium]|nr:transposase [Deltaproteobacteria bacterium]